MTAVSVVTPFRDAERHLAEAIRSVQSQTWGNWELVLVDDRSEDASSSIAAAAAADDPRVRLVRTPSGEAEGAAAARNKGIAASVGEHIAFLDADDVYEPHQLETQLRAFRSYPRIAMVYGPTHWWHPGSEHRDWIEQMRPLAGQVHEPPALLNRVLLLQRGHVPCTCSVMIRRSALAAVGGFEESFDLYEDQTLWVKIMLRFPIFVSDAVGSRYRQHDASTTARSERSGRYDRMGPHDARVAFLQWIGDHVGASGSSVPSIEHALRLARASNGDPTVVLARRDRVTLAALACRRRWRGRIRVLRRRLLPAAEGGAIKVR